MVEIDVDPRLQLPLKIQEAAYYARDLLLNEDGLREMSLDEMKEFIFVMTSYLGEFMALAGVVRTDVWDDITSYQMLAHEHFDVIVDGLQLDIIADMVNQQKEFTKSASNPNTMFS